MKLYKPFTLLACIFTLWFTSLSAPAQGVFTSLISFTYTNGPDYGSFGIGSRSGAMVQAKDGNFYGTTPTGGVFTNVPGYFGTIFKMTPDGTFTSLYLFGTVLAGNNDNGHWPQGNLIQGADGNLYGTTQYGGPPNGGTVFQITTNGNLTTFYNFGNSAGFDAQLGWTNYDGDAPVAGLIQGRDGNFYGTTTAYGAFGNGTVFQLTPGGVLTTLHSFTALAAGNFYTNADGANPTGELIEGKDGNFYGTTTQGGTNAYGAGTVFQITPGGLLTTLHSFASGNGGCWGGLVQGNDGTLYGTTSQSGNGTIFQVTTNGTFTTLHTFSGNDGAAPSAALIQASDGNLYGTTEGAGPNGWYGTVFQITTNGTFTTLHSFNGTNGANPTASLVQAADGSLYGTTSKGGAGYGSIFRIVVPPVFQTISRTNGGLAFTWNAMPKQNCQLQYNTDVVSTNWLDLGSSITATNPAMSALDSSVPDMQRFYRIKLLP